MTDEATAFGAVAGPAEGEATRNPFAVGSFRAWWAASVVAGTGVGIQTVTVPLFIRDRVAEDNRAAAIAAALFAQNAIAAIFALFGGVVADRVERRRILVRTYGVAALVSVGYVLLVASDVGSIWPVYPLAAVVGAAGAFTNPARQSMLSQILQRSQLQNGIILGTMAFMATLQFGGPTLGGFLADGPGLGAAFATEVALLAAAALLFSTILSAPPVPTGKSVLADLRSGVGFVWRRKDLLGVLALGAIPGVFFMGPFAVSNVLMVEDVYQRGDKFVGILWGSLGAGILLGSVLMTVVRLPRRGLMLCYSVVFGGGALLIFGATSNVWLAIPTLVVGGVVGPAIFINFAGALLQENTEGAMIGRVMSMYSLSFTASTPLGFAWGGTLASVAGPQQALVTSGILMMACGVLAVLFLGPVKRLG